jgi:hypothetical protein
MTADDPMTAQERALRDRLHAEIAPPPTPDRLVYALDELAADEMASGRPGRWATWRAVGLSRRARAAVALAVAVVLVAGTLLVGTNLRDQPSVAASPSPPIVTPAPVDAGHVGDAAWLGPTTAWSEEMVGIGQVRFTLDSGRTWSSPRPIPEPFGGPGILRFLDTSFGYAAETTIPDGSSVNQSAVEVSRTVWVTRDGGLTWSSALVDREVTGDWNHTQPGFAVHFSDPQHGVALAGDAVVQPAASPGDNSGLADQRCRGWSTDDGGVTWKALSAIPCAGVVQWAGPTVGIALRSTWPDGGRTQVTLDGGRTWTAGTIPGVTGHQFVEYVAFGVEPSGVLRLVVAAPLPSPGEIPYHVLESGSSGASWHEAYPMTSLGSGLSWPFFPLDADHWLSTVFDWRVLAQTSSIVETLDGGRTWSNGASLAALGTNNVSVAQWFDRLHGTAVSYGNPPDCVVGTESACSRWFLTDDGGLTWNQIQY